MYMYFYSNPQYLPLWYSYPCSFDIHLQICENPFKIYEIYKFKSTLFKLVNVYIDRNQAKAPLLVRIIIAEYNHLEYVVYHCPQGEKIGISDARTPQHDRDLDAETLLVKL